jgi:hypothetical protein
MKVARLVMALRQICWSFSSRRPKLIRLPSGKNIEKALRHFEVRLGIEYHRLVQWGEDSGFSPDSGATDASPASTRQLQNKALFDIVERTLISIKGILEDLAGLTEQYGVTIVDEVDEVLVEEPTRSNRRPRSQMRSVQDQKMHPKMTELLKTPRFSFIAIKSGQKIEV